MKAEGKVWKFPDGVNTDLITPGKYLFLPLEQLATHALEVLDPTFAKEVKRGDVLVAGRNFGCGSSREQAPTVLKLLGVSVVVAESFARIFYRNCIATGLPVLPVPGICAAVAAGATLAVDLASGEVIDRQSGAMFHGRPLPAKMLEVVSQGGIFDALKQIGAAQT